MAQYKEKPKDLALVEAVQFGRGDHPLGEDPETFYDMRVAVDVKGAYVMMGNDVARSGDFLVSFADGSKRLMAAADFYERFELFEVKPPKAPIEPIEPIEVKRAKAPIEPIVK